MYHCVLCFNPQENNTLESYPVYGLNMFCCMLAFCGTASEK